MCLKQVVSPTLDLGVELIWMRDLWGWLTWTDDEHSAERNAAMSILTAAPIAEVLSDYTCFLIIP